MKIEYDPRLVCPCGKRLDEPNRACILHDLRARELEDQQGFVGEFFTWVGDAPTWVIGITGTILYFGGFWFAIDLMDRGSAWGTSMGLVAMTWPFWPIAASKLIDRHYARQRRKSHPA